MYIYVLYKEKYGTSLVLTHTVLTFCRDICLQFFFMYKMNLHLLFISLTVLTFFIQTYLIYHPSFIVLTNVRYFSIFI